jgi:hypothetical protein
MRKRRTTHTQGQRQWCLVGSCSQALIVQRCVSGKYLGFQAQQICHVSEDYPMRTPTNSASSSMKYDVQVEGLEPSGLHKSSHKACGGAALQDEKCNQHADHMVTMQISAQSAECQPRVQEIRLSDQGAMSVEADPVKGGASTAADASHGTPTKSPKNKCACHISMPRSESTLHLWPWERYRGSGCSVRQWYSWRCMCCFPACQGMT